MIGKSAGYDERGESRVPAHGIGFSKLGYDSRNNNGLSFFPVT